MTYPDDPYRPRFVPFEDQPAAGRVAAPPPQAPRPPVRPPRKKHGWLLWIFLVPVAFVLGVGGVLAWKTGLTGNAPAQPLTCAQQYAAWKTGPAKAAGQKLTAALDTVRDANDDVVTMDSGLKQAGADASQLQTAYPMPACADPAGYYRQFLGDVKAAGDNAGSATGLAGLIAAEVPLKQVPALETKLTAELKTTTR